MTTWRYAIDLGPETTVLIIADGQPPRLLSFGAVVIDELAAALRTALQVDMLERGTAQPTRAVVIYPAGSAAPEITALTTQLVADLPGEVEAIPKPVALARGYRARYALPRGTCLVVLNVQQGSASAAIVRRIDDDLHLVGLSGAGDRRYGAEGLSVVSDACASAISSMRQDRSLLSAVLCVGSSDALSGVTQMVESTGLGLPVISVEDSRSATVFAALADPVTRGLGAYIHQASWDDTALLRTAREGPRRRIPPPRASATSGNPLMDALRALPTPPSDTASRRADQPSPVQADPERPRRSASSSASDAAEPGGAFEPPPDGRLSPALSAAKVPASAMASAPQSEADAVSPNGSRRRGILALAAVVLVVVVGCGTGWVLLNSSHHTRQTAGVKPGHVPSAPSSTPSSTESPSGTPPTLPPSSGPPLGWGMRQEAGFSVAVPLGWQRRTEPGSVFYQDPSDQYLLQISTTDWQGDPQSQAANVEQSLPATFPGARDAGITPTSYHGMPAADLEFVFDEKATGTTAHALDRFFHMGAQAYAVYFRMPADQWASSGQYLNTIFDTLTLTSSNTP